MESSSHEANGNTNRVGDAVSWRGAGGIVCVAAVIFWMIAAGIAAHARPSYTGSLPPGYTFNQYLASKGVDLEKGLPLHFGSALQDGASIGFVNSTSNNVQLNFQVGSHGYVFSVSRDYINLQTGPSNWIRMSTSLDPTYPKFLGENEPPPSKDFRSYRLEPITGQYDFGDALLMHSHPARNRIVKVPISSSPPGRHMNKIGVGSFLQEAQQNNGAITAVFITLTPEALEKYKSQILK